MFYYWMKAFLKEPRSPGPKAEMIANKFLLYATHTFGIPYPLTTELVLTQPKQCFVQNMILEVKGIIVEKDVGRIFDAVGPITKGLDAPFLNTFPALSVQVYRALRRETMPLIYVLNDTLRRHVDYQNRLAMNDEGINIFELGVSKYMIGANIINLRAAHSISLAESQMVK